MPHARSASTRYTTSAHNFPHTHLSTILKPQVHQEQILHSPPAPLQPLANVKKVESADGLRSHGNGTNNAEVTVKREEVGRHLVTMRTNGMKSNRTLRSHSLAWSSAAPGRRLVDAQSCANKLYAIIFQKCHGRPAEKVQKSRSLFLELPGEIRNRIYEFLIPDYPFVRLRHRPSRTHLNWLGLLDKSMNTCDKGQFTAALSVTQLCSQTRYEFRPLLMRSISTFITELSTLDIFITDFDMQDTIVTTIMTALRQERLHGDGVNIVPLLQFLWTTDRLSIAMESWLNWHPIALVATLFDHRHLRKMVNNGSITTITLSNMEKTLAMNISMVNVYNTKCNSVVKKDMECIFRYYLHFSLYNKRNGLIIICNSEGVTGKASSGSSLRAFITKRHCHCMSTGSCNAIGWRED
ncbi:hypothetical protein EJ04DRAFT_549740 [Polyplosphaeria fusca]|uniref:F-box domain-containing protein n=1 Tax=Polyplosphaeria fusca TaxID=682080 RepID=A0A9P4R7I7_9PLEO|nr:hypothetical protein EJ04DRAFT_549740 [Polyplosphaeria fusca]